MKAVRIILREISKKIISTSRSFYFMPLFFLANAFLIILGFQIVVKDDRFKDVLLKSIQALRSPDAIPSLLFAITASVTVIAVTIAMFSFVRVRAQSEVEFIDQEKLDEITRKITDVAKKQSTNLQNELSDVGREILELRGELANYQHHMSPWDRIFADFQRRMDREKSRIRGASIVNLLLGLLFSLAALYVISQSLNMEDVTAKVLAFQGKYMAAYCGVGRTGCSSAIGWSPQAELWFAFAQHALPRVTLGVLIQVVGFFFLRLYVANELDLKHTKNELTNFDAWMVALHLSRDPGAGRSPKPVIERLSATERNFILKKNERTVGIETRSDHNDLVELLKKIAAMAPSGEIK